MPNSYYNHATYPSPNAPGSSAALRAELDLVTAGFNLLPTLAGNGYKVAMVNAAGTALIASAALQNLTIDNSPIGATTANTGRFTTVTATAASGFFGNLVGNVTGDITSAGTSTFANVTISGSLDMQTITAATISGLNAPSNNSDAANKGYVDTQDALKLSLAGGTMSGNIAMGTNRITGMGDPSSAQDAATKNYIDTLFGSTTAAAASAAAAATSATNAANSATAAATSASNASTSASNAASSYTTFNNQYLGPKASDPSVNNTGGALVAGNLYFNTTASEMRVYNGTVWAAAYLPAAGYLPLAGGTMTGAITFSGGQTWPTFNQSTTGNAATATALQTARTINGVSFDGTANITVADSTKLPLAGGTMSGAITFAGGQTFPGTGDVTAAGNNAFTGANTFFNATGQTFGTATSSQDGIILAGRSGGTSSYRVTLQPTTLSANRTLTLPNVTDTVATIGTAQTFTAAQTFRAANAIRSEAASTQDAVVVAGRAGGTSSRAVTITPTTLTASRTVTLPDADTTIPVATQVITFSGPTAARTYTLPDAASTLAALATAQTFTALQTFSGSTSVAATKLANAKEVATISATAATGTINYDITTQSVLYYTTNASANWTVNFRGSSGTSLDTLMSTGESMTVAFLVTQGSTAYYNSAVQVDGSSVTPKYQGGTAWSAGNASSIDAYVYTIVKTGSAAFTVFASQTRFA